MGYPRRIRLDRFSEIIRFNGTVSFTQMRYLGTDRLTWLQRCPCQRSSFPTCTSRGWFFFRIIISTKVSRTRTIIRMRSVESGKWPHHRLGISSQEEASSKSAAPEYSQILCNAKRKSRDTTQEFQRTTTAQGVNEDVQVASLA